MEQYLLEREQEQELLGKYLVSSFDFNDSETLDKLFAFLRYFNIPFERYQQDEGLDLLLGNHVDCDLFLKKSIMYQEDYERRDDEFWTLVLKESK